MGRPKHELQLPDGRLLLDHMLDLCDAVAGQTMLCGGDVPESDRTVLQDRVRGAGPLAGVEALLRAAGSGRCLVLPCDMPALDVKDLLSLARVEGDIVHFDVPSGSPLQCLPMIIDARQLPALEKFIDGGGRAMHRFMDGVDHVGIPHDAPERLLNINSPDDWAAYVESC